MVNPIAVLTTSAPVEMTGEICTCCSQPIVTSGLTIVTTGFDMSNVYFYMYCLNDACTA